MANKRKNPNTTNLNELPLERTTKSIDEYLDMLTMRQKPVSDAFIERLAQDLVTWVNEILHRVENDIKGPHQYKVSQFFRRRGIDGHTLQRWCKRNQKFLAAYDYALTTMGDIREIGGLTRKLDPGMVSSSMHLYDSAWKQGLEWRESIKHKEQQQSNVTVIMQPIESSPMVKTPEEVAALSMKHMQRGAKPTDRLEWGRKRKEYGREDEE